MKRVSLFAVVAVMLAVGCYETEVNLGSSDEAKVDRSLVGDWAFAARGDEKPVSLIVRNLDDKQYFVQWKDEGEKPVPAVGFIVPVKDAMFAQIRPLLEDGSISDKHWIVRIASKDGNLSIRQLSDDFMKQQTVTTTAQLRQVLEKHVDDAMMYDGQERVGTKQPTAQ